MQCIPNIQTRKYSSPETLHECGPEVSYIQFSIHQKHLILYHRVVILVLWITFPTFFSRQSIGNVQDDRGVRQEWILARPLYWYQPRTQALPLVLSSLGGGGILFRSKLCLSYFWKSKLIRNEDRSLGKDPQMPGADRKGYGLPEKGPKWASNWKYAHMWLFIYQSIPNFILMVWSLL